MAGQSLIHSNPNSESIPIANHPVHNTLATAANLANLLPTGTVLAFQALTPSFTNNGTCQVSNQYLTATLLLVFSSICFISSFTDSFTYDGKLHYGIATFKGLYVFDEFNGEDANGRQKDLSKYKLRPVDLVHAFMSLIVFLVFGFSSSNVQGCFFPAGGGDLTALTTNLPLGVGVLSSFLFTIFPTTRRGIGYSDMVPQDTYIHA
ncbi:hypothetical protein QQ045_010794 [Rhodiola kirilowii]